MLRFSARPPPAPRARALCAPRRAPIRPPRAAGSDDDAPSGEDDPTAAALRAELARRASGGSGPLPPAPRWADDGARGGGGGGDEDVPPQLAASRALVNEGLSGFLPRVKALVSFGAAFAVAPPFWGAAAAIAIAFTLLYAATGDSFIHGGRPATGPPPVVDPYDLLDELPREAPYVGFRERME